MTFCKETVIINMVMYRRKKKEGSVFFVKPAFEHIVGNEPLKKRLADDIQNNRLSHAYILEGPHGSGKHTIALAIAAALACQHKTDETTPLPCCKCPACKKVFEGNSPDVIYIRREEDRSTMGVDVIRELRQDVSISPNELSAKIYLIEEAHLMTEGAQNAFLLTLEEPPPYVLFLLLCDSSAVLLETVKSRAPILRTEPIDAAWIGRHLCSISREAASLAATSQVEFSEITAAANGSIGMALELLNPKKRKPIVAKRELAREFVRLCCERKNTLHTVRFLNGLTTKRDELIEQFNAILLCLRDLLLCKQTENAPLCFFVDKEEACSLAYSFTTPELLDLCDAIGETVDRLRNNANVRLTLTAFATECKLIS